MAVLTHIEMYCKPQMSEALKGGPAVLQTHPKECR